MSHAVSLWSCSLQRGTSGTPPPPLKGALGVPSLANAAKGSTAGMCTFHSVKVVLSLAMFYVFLLFFFGWPRLHFQRRDFQAEWRDVGVSSSPSLPSSPPPPTTTTTKFWGAARLQLHRVALKLSQWGANEAGVSLL